MTFNDHLLADEAKALVERLRWSHWYYEDAGENTSYTSEAPLEAADLIEAQAREIERLRGALAAYTEYCGICHGRGSFIEEDAVTGADLWRDCPGCTPARAALGESHD